MTPVELISVIGGVGAGLIAALGILGIFIKHAVGKMMETIERVPAKDWFDKVENILDGLPTAERIETHLAQGHVHANLLQVHEFKINKIDRSVDDHEMRLREVEAK